MGCHPYWNPKCSPTDKHWWDLYRNDTIANLQPVVDSDRDGIFLDACCQHCQSNDNGHPRTWTTVAIGGVTPADSFEAWMSGGASAQGAKLVDAGPYGTNPTCVGWGHRGSRGGSSGGGDGGGGGG